MTRNCMLIVSVHLISALLAVILLVPSCRHSGAREIYGRQFSSEEHAAMTTLRMKQLASLVHASFSSGGGYPVTLADISAIPAFERDAELASRNSLFFDTWRQPIQYHVSNNRMQFSLLSFGADGREGGAGAAADIEIEGSMQSDDQERFP